MIHSTIGRWRYSLNKRHCAGAGGYYYPVGSNVGTITQLACVVGDITQSHACFAERERGIPFFPFPPFPSPAHQKAYGERHTAIVSLVDR